MPFDEQEEIVDFLSGSKVSKKEANYRPLEEGGDGKCEDCMFYEFPGNDDSKCAKVSGRVYADDTCDLWEANVEETGLPAQGLGEEGMLTDGAGY